MTTLPHEQHPQRSQALVGLLVANFFWGLSFPLIKGISLLLPQLVPGSSTSFITAMSVAPRFVFAIVLLFAWQALRGNLTRWRRGEIIQGSVIGLFAGVGMFFQNDGLQFTEASTSAFLTQFYAIMIPVYLALRTRHNPGARVWWSGALVLVGVAILGRFDWHEMRFGRGEWETLVSSVFFMVQILWLEKKEFADNRPIHVTTVMFSVQAVLFCGFATITAPSLDALCVPLRSPAWLGFSLTLTFLCTIGSYLLMNTWQPKITATEAGLIYCIEPIFSSVMALFLPGWFSLWAGINYPNESATWSLLAGGGLITVANILVQMQARKEEKIVA